MSKMHWFSNKFSKTLEAFRAP